MASASPTDCVSRTGRAWQKGGAHRLTVFCVTLIFALVVALPRIAFAEELAQGVLLLTEDVWAVGVINSDTPPEISPTPSAEDGESEAHDDAPMPIEDSGFDPEQATQPEAPSQEANPEADTTSPTTPAADSMNASIAQQPVQTPVDTAQNQLSQEAINISTSDDGRAYEADAVMVSLAPNSGTTQLKDIISAAQSAGLALVPMRVTQTDLDYGVVCLSIADGTSVDNAITKISQLSGVIAAQRNYLYASLGTVGTTTAEDAQSAYATPNDQLSAQVARTKVSDKLTNENWVADAINAREAWDLVKSCGSVAVAVIDTGADLTHPDLAANIIASYNSYDSNLSAQDDNGHGTHVAGIIAGVADNALGLTGVSYDAKLVIIKASTPRQNNFDTASIVRAYAWLMSVDETTGLTRAETYGVRVVNMSIGGVDDSYCANLYDDNIVQAMLNARNKGILTICAAGNKGSSASPYLTYPGDSDVCLSVMNLTKRDDGSYDLSDTSNYNPAGTSYKDVCAPGTTIYSTWTNGLFAIQSGTSMATPVVSGVAALMFAANPALTPTLAMDLIELSCTDLGDEGWDERYGYGMVNAEAAVRLASDLALVGPTVIGVGSNGSHAYAHVGFTNAADTNGWTWSTSPVDGGFGAGSALVSADGVLTGLLAGDVVLYAGCTAANGAQLAVELTVHVIDAVVAGAEALTVGESANYAIVDALDAQENLDGYGWAWFVDEGTHCATIDADGVLTALAPGVVTVRAYGLTNSKLTFCKEIEIAA